MQKRAPLCTSSHQSSMRRGEEDQLEKCINVIKTMKSAISRQQSVSGDVKKSVETAGRSRAKWKKSEVEEEMKIR